MTFYPGLSSSLLASIPQDSTLLIPALFGTAAFGVLGIALMLFGFKAFELLTRRLDIEKQLEDRNIAVGVVVAALMLGISLIVIVSMQ